MLKSKKKSVVRKIGTEIQVEAWYTLGIHDQQPCTTVSFYSTAGQSTEGIRKETMKDAPERQVTSVSFWQTKKTC